jgi:hypothetical protein
MVSSESTMGSGRRIVVTMEVVGQGEKITAAFALAQTKPRGQAPVEAESSARPPTVSSKCNLCDKEFGDGVKAWTAGGAVYCQECFCCSYCGLSLESEDLFSVNGRVYCSKHNPDAEACGSCGEALVSGKVISALDKKFHARCFVCAEPGCGQEFGNGATIFLADGKPFCDVHAPSTEEEEEEWDSAGSEY